MEKSLTTGSQQCIKGITHQDEENLVLGMQGWFNI